MKVLYFAWLRERLNRASDEVSPPPEVVTLADLVAWLRSQDEALDLAMTNPAIFKLSRDARTTPKPSGFKPHVVERRNTLGQDGPPVRTAVGPGGAVYGAFLLVTRRRRIHVKQAGLN